MLFNKYPRCTTMASAAVVALFVAGSPALADEHGHSDDVASQESSGDAQSTKTIEDKGSNDATASGGMDSFGDGPATASDDVTTAGDGDKDWLEETDDDATNDEWLAESGEDEVTPADAMEPGDYDSAGDATSQDGTIAGETGTYDDDAGDPDATASEGVVMNESESPVIPDSTRSTGPGESTFGESAGDEMKAAGDEVKAAASHTASETSDKWIQTKIESTFAMDDETSAWDIDTEVEGGIVWLHGTVDSESEKQRAETLARDIEGVQEVRNELEVSAESIAMGEDHDSDDAMAATGDDQELGIDNSEVNGDETMDADDNVAATEEDASGIYASSDENELGTEEEGLEDEAGGVAMAAGDATMTAKVKTKLLTADDIAGTDINVDVANGVVTLRGRVSSEEERMRALELARSVEDVQSVEDELVVQASD